MDCDCNDMGECYTHRALSGLADRVRELEARLKKLEEEPKVVYKTVYVRDGLRP